jgi:predicted TIM-barrel fold metal-dependent hydrolase
VIVDIHTHVFPLEVIADRERYLPSEPTFRELYASPKARLASANDLVRSMNDASIDVSVVLGFAWRDLDLCRRHNDCLLEAAAKSNGRIVAFCTLPLAAGPEAIVAEAERCAAGGARGFGELRPESAGVDLNELAEALKEAGHDHRMLLFHVSEPVGHAYPGKEGFALEAFYRFVQAHPETKVVGAHWGGGLPFYALMPEVRLALAKTSFDTAGTSLLYTPDVYRRGIDLVRAESILFGSDFPLLSQSRSRQRIEAAGLDDADRDAILGGNTARLLGLE